MELMTPLMSMKVSGLVPGHLFHCVHTFYVSVGIHFTRKIDQQ